MIASPDVLYDIRRKPPRPAMVRESMGAGSAAEAHPDAIPTPSRPEPVSAPSPSEAGKPDDDLARLGDRIAELAAGINAAEAQMMTLIADFDRRGGWKDDFGSCAEWLAWRIGIKIGPARERVRAARALENLPQTAGALREGSISYAKVRALTRVATPESEAKLLEFARAGSAANLEQMVRMWKKLSRDAELTAEQARHRSRAFSVFVDGDGMYVVKGRLEPEVGAVLMRAVEAASDALFRGECGASDARPGAKARDPGVEKADPRPEPKQRRADAVGLLAERALAMGFGDGEPPDSIPQRLGAGPAAADSTPRRIRHPRGALPGHGPLRCRDAGGGGRARTLGSGRDPRLRGNVAAHGVRCRGGGDGPREGRVDAERGPEDAHDSSAHPAGAGGARSRMPVSRVWLPVHRGASREALGRRGRNQPREHSAAMPAASSRGSRGAGEVVGGHGRDGGVLHARREDAGRRAETGLEGFGPGPSSSSHRPGEGRWHRALKRGCALPRFSHPVGDRSRCAGSCGGISVVTTRDW